MAALSYIEVNIGDRITLADMAAAAGLSPYHFSRAFAVSMGTPPVRYLWARRLVIAQTLLSTTSTPIAQIALDCGFSDQSSFTTAFRRLTDMTPAAFRSTYTLICSLVILLPKALSMLEFQVLA